jgi:ribosomal protein L12E/L44/L45/RPP1/RPP2
MSDAIVSYAALILSDAGLEITSENLLTLTKAAGASVDKVSLTMKGFHNAVGYTMIDVTGNGKIFRREP